MKRLIIFVALAAALAAIFVSSLAFSASAASSPIKLAADPCCSS